MGPPPILASENRWVQPVRILETPAGPGDAKAWRPGITVEKPIDGESNSTGTGRFRKGRPADM